MSNSESPSGRDILVSVIISTYNRRQALIETLRALSVQSLPPQSYEVIVVDDGSTDGTFDAVERLELACQLRLFRLARNQGVSAGRNVAIRNAVGRYLIFLSDDLIVPTGFIEVHVRTLIRFPGYWVVGGFRQLPSLRESPFGRFLDDLEEGFATGRKTAMIEPNIWELRWPTARNLSVPREHIEQVGLFDEWFRVACEDQDLAQRARQIGIRFLYNEEIESLHNDQSGDLSRYCRFQRRGACDGVRLCAKYPDVHGGSPLITTNGYVTIRDGPVLMTKKVIKNLLARDLTMAIGVRAAQFLEQRKAPEAFLRRVYHVLIALSIFRGWRDGLSMRVSRATPSR